MVSYRLVYVFFLHCIFILFILSSSYLHRNIIFSLSYLYLIFPMLSYPVCYLILSYLIWSDLIFISLSLYLSISISLSLCLSIYLSFYVSIYIYLSLSLSLYIYVLHTHVLYIPDIMCFNLFNYPQLLIFQPPTLEQRTGSARHGPVVRRPVGRHPGDEF